MSLFAISKYGVPVALVGVAYVILMTPILLVRNDRHRLLLTSRDANNNDDDILLGARLTQWSPASGRTIKRSGLRDTGGIYLVSVKRRATGNVHTAVSPEFVLEVDDILYFTGMIDTFGDFCEEHGLEVVTNEVELEMSIRQGGEKEEDEGGGDEKNVNDESETLLHTVDTTDTSSSSPMSPLRSPSSSTNARTLVKSPKSPLQRMQSMEKLKDLGTTLDSLVESTLQERMRVVYSMEDSIRDDSTSKYQHTLASRVVVANHDDLVIIAIDAPDRSGLLLDISKCLSRLQLELRHTEATVLSSNARSLSIWRCQAIPTATSSSETTVTDNLSEIWTVVHTLFETGSGIEAVRRRGVQVMRARVRDGSRLAGKSLSKMNNFRELYKAAILAIQKMDGQVHTESFATVLLDVGDVLILQVEDDSPLLVSPPPSPQDMRETKKKSDFFKRTSNVPQSVNTEVYVDVEDAKSENEAVWNDLEAVTKTGDSAIGAGVKREFLTAMAIDGSNLVGKTVSQAGIDKIPGLYLVNIDRPCTIPESHPPVESFSSIPLTEPLEQGDVLWFCGAATDVGELRKIPGMILYDSGEVSKMNEKAQNRRLVEAVVSRNGPLVGKTAKEVKFRTTHGAAVISVSREGKRVHEFPGNVKFHAGDVLLLEAGKTFMEANKNQQDKAFTLISEVDNSSPPRFRMLFPAVFLTVGAYVWYMLKVPKDEPISLFGTSMVAAILMVMVGVLSEAEARAAIRWEIYLTIAPAFGVGQALINSGVAGTLSAFLVRVGEAMGIGDAGLLGSVYLATVLMSQVVANNAAAALIFPIAMGAAEQAGISLDLMAFAIMLAASAAFMTPFGYQTNLMVMGPGGYSTADFLIFGTPMQVVLTVVSTVALVTQKLWYLVWLASLGILVTVSVLRYGLERKKIPGKKY